MGCRTKQSGGGAGGRKGQVLYDKPQLGLGGITGGSLRLPGFPRLEDNLEISGLPGCGGQTWEVGTGPLSRSRFWLASEKVTGLALVDLGMDYKVKPQQ